MFDVLVLGLVGIAAVALVLALLERVLAGLDDSQE